MAARRALHFVFKVGDRGRTARFYRDLLGMRVSGAAGRGGKMAGGGGGNGEGRGLSPTSAMGLRENGGFSAGPLPPPPASFVVGSLSRGDGLLR